MRNKYCKLEIEAIADHVLKKYSTSNNINPVLIANKIGLKVMEDEMEKDTIGILDVTNSNIIVNSNDNLVNKRFSIARLIGNFILHVRGFKGMESKKIANKNKFIVYKNSVLTLQFSLIYIEAFYLALNLLLPKRVLLDAIKNNIKLSSDDFGVSKAIFSMRLNYL